MRKVLVLLAALLQAATLDAQSTAKGPMVDRVVFESRALEEAGLKDVASGKVDLWASPIGSRVLDSLSDDARTALDLYPVFGTTVFSLLVNPFPGAAPYTSTTGAGRTVFNPLAIPELRFALNLLIDRSRLIDEQLGGAALPQFTPVSPGLPVASLFTTLPARLGLAPAGDEVRALRDIESAMSAAAALPQNAGRLVRGDAWWTYDGDPVTVRFVIRNDDQDPRLGVGRAVADRIEKAGIRVERAEMGGAAARKLLAQSDPADRLWDLYTEAWAGGRGTAFPDGLVADMYAPANGNLPGGGRAGAWSYQDAAIDRLCAAAADTSNPADYNARLSEAISRGLAGSVRIFLAAQTSYVAAGKSRATGRMVTSPCSGMGAWSLATIDVPAQKDGTHVLRMIALAPPGSLFASPWDPIGAGGFADANSGLFSDALSDREALPNPVSGTYMPVRVSWSRVRSDFSRGSDGSLTGRIAVSPGAVLWNARSRRWEKGVVFAPDDGPDGGTYRSAASITACSQATFAFRSGEWHDGRLIDINDYRYALSLPWDVATRKGDGDRIYDSEYAQAVGRSLGRCKGFVFGKDGTITVYGDTVFPADQGRLASLLCPRLVVSARGAGAAVPWEVLEAVKKIVADCGPSKTAWSYGSNPDLTEVDLLDPRCAADIAAALEELASDARVPDALKGFVAPAQAVADYRLARDFIVTHGHALISNGPFILDSYDPSTGSGSLVANRDPSYPFPKGYWGLRLAASLPSIDSLTVVRAARDSPATVTVVLRATSYPAGTSKPAEVARVKVTLLGAAPGGYTAGLVAAGTYRTVIPARDLAALKPGTYLVQAEATLGTVTTNPWGTTAVATAELIVP